MIKAIFIGSDEVRSYKTKNFHASRGNTVYMPLLTWNQIKEKGDDKLFAKVEKLKKVFPIQKTVMPSNLSEGK